MATISNPNWLNPTGFLVQIQRLPEVSFFCHSVEIPGLSTSNPDQPNMFTRLPMPGDFPQQGELTLNFNVDEELTNWISVYQWLVGITYPENHEQYTALINSDLGRNPGDFDNIYSDISIIVLSSHKNRVAEFTFYDCIPNNISSISLNALESDISPLTASVTFDFSYFRIAKPGDGVSA